MVAAAIGTGSRAAPLPRLLYLENNTDNVDDDGEDDETKNSKAGQQQQQLVVSSSSSTATTMETNNEDDEGRSSSSSPSKTNPIANHPKKNNNTTNTTKKKKQNPNNDDDDEITFLIEIVKATLPKKRSSSSQRKKKSSSATTKNKGMHCTARWVGPINPSGRKRREKLLHRTKTMNMDDAASSSSSTTAAEEEDGEDAIASKKNGRISKEEEEDDENENGFYDCNNEEENEEEEQQQQLVDCTEHIFTVNDASLFLFRTTMKQLVNASSLSSNHDGDGDGDGDVDNCRDDTSSPPSSNGGGIRFDIFEKPLDMLTSVYSTVLADTNVSEKEHHALTRDSLSSSSNASSTSMGSYRLVGSVFLSPHDVLEACDEVRFEKDLMSNYWNSIHGQQQQRKQGGNHRSSPGSGSFQNGIRSNSNSTTIQRVDGGKLALRIRVASEFDVAFMKSLQENENKSAYAANVALQMAMANAGTSSSSSTTGSSSNRSNGSTSNRTQELQPAQLITEMDENRLTAETSLKTIANLSPMAKESVRYLFSNDTEKRLLVKPYPDPSRVEETTWFTEEALQEECYRGSTHWIRAGQEKSSSMGGGTGGGLGTVYLEVLECRGLPNTDAGGSIGNKTDAFVSVVYGDIMVQTEVIDDSCSPMWMPWSSRAFVFQMSHPSTAIYIGVADYDVGPMEHECIGRVAIDMEKFFPDTLYTLTYNLYESSNLTEKGENLGSITIRLRLEIPNEKKYLMAGWKAPPERKWVNSQQWKSHRIAKYCVDGPHDEEVFEMRLFRSHINELLTQKRYLSYAISDAIRSLIFWRGQVKVGNVWLPLHSAIVYYCSFHVVEKPHLLPSFLLFICGWILIANMLTRASHPSPWHRGHSFAHHWNVLTQGESFHAAGNKNIVRPNQGRKEANKIEARWKKRLADADAEYAKQAELDARIKTISDDAIIRTKAKANGALVDPISAVAGARLLPYQQRLSGYCNKVRYIRNVLNWNESIISFRITLFLFGAAFAALFVPWGFIFRWATRLVVWVGLGPWMRIFDLFFHEETERQKKKASKKKMKLFHEQRKTAKILREQALKMKAFRVKLFGQFITRLPEFNLTRHEDVPLPESFAQPYHSEEEIKTFKFVPSQDLTGTMIPMTGQDAAESESRKQKEKEGLFCQYQDMIKKEPQSTSSLEDELDEGFELVSAEDRLICLPSEPFDRDTDKESASSEITHARSNSIQDAGISDKAIQLALEKELQEHKKLKAPKTKWIFSAQVSLSLRKETVQETTHTTPAIDNGTHKELIEDMDTIQEEGVEIVPFIDSDPSTAESDSLLKLENDTSHVSVFYMKDGLGHTMNDSNQVKEADEANEAKDELEKRDDDNVTANAVKRIRFKNSFGEID